MFSGTIAGSAPVMIHDDQFRFDVNLITGEESGQVYLFNHIAGPKVRCTLDVVGTGLNAEGNPHSTTGAVHLPRSMRRLPRRRAPYSASKPWGLAPLAALPWRPLRGRPA